jgi:hypothetical protein
VIIDKSVDNSRQWIANSVLNCQLADFVIRAGMCEGLAPEDLGAEAAGHPQLPDD